MNNCYEMFTDYADVVKVPEVEKMVRLSKNTVYKLIHEGKLKSVKVGKRNLLITKQSVINFVNDIDAPKNKILH